MLAESMGRGQQQSPDAPQASDTTQPDLAALQRRERRQQQRNASVRRWRQRHPEEAGEKNRVSSAKWRQQHPDEARAKNINNYYKHREQRLAYAEEYKRLQNESLTGGGTVFNEFDYWMSEPAQERENVPNPDKVSK